MAMPVGGTNLGSPEQNLKAQVVRWIRDELANAARGGIGLHVDGATGNLIIDEGEIQSGNYAAGSAGWALLPNGDAEFNVLTLRSGIIGNDALANPVYPDHAQADEGYPTGFTLTALDVPHAVATVTVPAGFTRCSVVAISTARGVGSTDWNFGMKTRINGLDGDRTTFGTNTSTNSGGTLSGSCANTETLTGLTSGGTFDVSTVMSVNSGTPAVSVTTVASLLYLR